MLLRNFQIPTANPKHYAVTFLSSQTLRKFDQNASQSACRTSNSATFSSTDSLASSESSLDSTASNLLSTALKHVHEFLYASGLPYLSVKYYFVVLASLRLYIYLMSFTSFLTCLSSQITSSLLLLS